MAGMTQPAALTALEARTVAAIQDLTDGAIGPSLDAIATTVGCVKSNVFRLLCQLEAKGWIHRVPYKARSITLLHRLPPKPQAAVVELITTLNTCMVDPDGSVYVRVPKTMIAAAAAALNVA